MVKNGKINTGINHSFISNGTNVEYAGTVTFGLDGNIVSFSNNSGHYQPSAGDNAVFVDAFQSQFGIDIHQTPFNSVNN